jgi:hypothetical protein
MSTPRARRTKRIVAGGIALAVVVAGVAFAFFSTDATSANAVSGGQLKVTTDGLPLVFGTQKLYPTPADDPQNVITSDFTITNDNPVDAGYAIFATDKSTGDDGKAQFQNLYIRITSTSTTTTQMVPGQQTPFDQTRAETTPPYYEGKLADLDAAHLAGLGSITKGGDRTYDVAVWLADTGAEQPQNVPSNFALTVRATTPSTAPSTTSTTTAP